jgi:hypothetical protein
LQFPHENALCAFPFSIICATYPTHLVFLDLIYVWIDLAQDSDRQRAFVKAVIESLAA